MFDSQVIIGNLDDGSRITRELVWISDNRIATSDKEIFKLGDDKHDEWSWINTFTIEEKKCRKDLKSGYYIEG